MQYIKKLSIERRQFPSARAIILACFLHTVTEVQYAWTASLIVFVFKV
jgi:hypothetical protein